MRRIVFGALLLIALLVAVGVTAVLLLDVNQFRGTIAGQIERRLHRQVALGKMGLSFLPLAIRVDDFSIADSPRISTATPFLSTKTLYIRVSLPALLRKQVKIEALRFTSPALELIKGPDGHWNFSDLGQSSTAPQGGNLPLSLEELRIDDASVAVTDLAAHKPRTVYDHIDLMLADLAPGRPFQLTIRGRAYGTEGAIEANGLWDGQSGLLTLSSLTAKTGGLTATGHGVLHTAGEPTVDIEFQTANAPIPELLRLAGAGDLAESGTISFALRAEGPASDPKLSGSGAVRVVKLKLEGLNKPLEIESAKLRLEADAVTAEELSARLASTTVHGTVTVRNLANPRLDFRVNADRIDVAELQQLAVPSPAAKPRGTTPAKPLSGAGSVAFGTLVYNQLTLTDVRADCKLDGGILHLDPVTAKAFGGETHGDITVDTRPGPGAYGVKVGLKSMDANQLLSATTSVKQIVFGLLSGDVDLQVRAKPGQNAARALNGNLQVQLNNGRLAGVNVLDNLASIARLLGYSKRDQPFTNILKLAGTMQIHDGLAQTNDLQMAFDGGSLAATGTLDLADQTLHMQLTSLLDKSIVPAVDRSQIGGWMTTVMANGKGQLVIPATVTGTLSAPKFLPDPERMAKMKVQGLTTPQGMADTAGQILGAIQGKKTAPPAGQSGKQPDAAQSILDMVQGLTKQKPK